MQYCHVWYKLAVSCWEPHGSSQTLTVLAATKRGGLVYSRMLVSHLYSSVCCPAVPVPCQDFARLPFLHEGGRRTNAETAASKPPSCGLCALKMDAGDPRQVLVSHPSEGSCWQWSEAITSWAVLSWNVLMHGLAWLEWHEAQVDVLPSVWPFLRLTVSLGSVTDRQTP